MREGPQCPVCFEIGSSFKQPASSPLVSCFSDFLHHKVAWHPKKPVLDPDARQTIVSALQFAMDHDRIYLRAFVIMHDHWHALVALREPWTLPKFMHDMMGFVGAKTSDLLKLHKTSWQDGYYDTHVKTAKQFQYVAYYIEQNPVAKGLADSPEEWDASSARKTDLVTNPWPRLYD